MVKKKKISSISHVQHHFDTRSELTHQGAFVLMEAYCCQLDEKIKISWLSSWQQYTSVYSGFLGTYNVFFYILKCSECFDFFFYPTIFKLQQSWDSCRNKSDLKKFVKHKTSAKKSRCVCETLCPRQQQSPKLAIFRIKITVKVTRSLAMVSFERVSLVEYACQIWSLYLLRFKSYGQG